MLGMIDQFVKFSLVQTRNGRIQRQRRVGDGTVLKRNCALNVQRVGGETSLLNVERELHGKTASMSCCDQLFRVGADAIFEAGVERVLCLVEDRTVGR